MDQPNIYWVIKLSREVENSFSGELKVEENLSKM